MRPGRVTDVDILPLTRENSVDIPDVSMCPYREVYRHGDEFLGPLNRSPLTRTLSVR